MLPKGAAVLVPAEGPSIAVVLADTGGEAAVRSVGSHPDNSIESSARHLDTLACLEEEVDAIRG
jgi:hypothetical protein